jgi:hypothetical protein
MDDRDLILDMGNEKYSIRERVRNNCGKAQETSNPMKCFPSEERQTERGAKHSLPTSTKGTSMHVDLSTRLNDVMHR